MNVWGFTPDYFDYSEAYFKDFLSDPKNMENKKSEYFIPLMVNKLINDGNGNSESIGYDEQNGSVLRMLLTAKVWVDRIQSLVDEGVYPAKLF